MLYVLPEKDMYMRAKYETTEELFHTTGTSSVTGIVGISSGQEQQQQQQRHERDVPTNGGNEDAEHEPPGAAAGEESNEQNDLREPLL